MKNFLKPKLTVIIQARCSSRRFKNKVMHLIYNKPLILHVIEKIKKTKKVKKIIVATSKNKTDDKLVKYLKKIKISCYRGELNNVAKRLYNAARYFKSKYFVRISADSPLIDSSVIDRGISILNKNKNYDLITNIHPRSFPKGQSVEILKTSTLGKILNKLNKSEKEHVTKYMYRNSSDFIIKSFGFNGKNKKFKLSIDTKKDLNKILKNIKKKDFENFSIKNEY